MAQNPVVNNIRIIPRDSEFLERNIGSSGEVFFNKQTNTLRLYNGLALGGFELAKDDLSNVTDADFLAKATSAGVGSGSSGSSQVFVSETAPSSPTEGNIWFNSSTGVIYVYVTDTDSSQWVQPSYPVFSGDYGDLSNKPTIPTDVADLTDNTNLLSGGSSYDQSLNTTDDVEFNTISATQFTNTGVGSPEIDSASTITLTAPDGVIVQSGPFRLPSFTTTEKNALSAVNGDMVYDSTLNKAQVYENGAWVNLV